MDRAPVLQAVHAARVARRRVHVCWRIPRGDGSSLSPRRARSCSRRRSDRMKLRYIVPAIVMVGLLALLWMGLHRDPREIPSPLIGKSIPSFALPGLEGKPAQITSRDL